VIYSKGNQSTQYSLGSTTSYARERWSAQATFDSNLSSSTGANVSTRNSLVLSARHLLPWNHWYYSGLGEFLQSSEQGIGLQSTFGGGLGRYLTNTDRASVSVFGGVEQGIGLQSTFGGGLGRYLTNTDRASVSVFGGVAWQRTSYQHSNLPSSEQNLAAALFYVQARLFKFSKTDLEATAAVLPGLSDPGRLRYNTDVAYYVKLISNLKWNVSFYGNWDNRPPPGFSGSDYGTSSGISWTFGLR
jgi:hypothetical protein